MKSEQRLATLILIAGWFACLGLCGWIEVERVLTAAASPAGVLSWFANWNPETTLPGLVLLLLPLAIWFAPVSRRRAVREAPQDTTEAIRCGASAWKRRVSAVLLACLSFGASAAIGTRSIEYATVSGRQTRAFHHLPPAYHDEFSYQLQAITFRAARWSFPPAPVAPELFHQFHVLNEPVTASRYFPWTGFCVAPFVDGRSPILGHWLAGGIAIAFLSLLLMRHLPFAWAVVAGALIAVSPGIAVFSNLLLSHHPVLMSLSIFLWAFDRFCASGESRFAWTAGIALSTAMLGRPMTAAGFALPFGCFLLLQWWRCRRKPAEAASSPAPQSFATTDPSSVGSMVVTNHSLLAFGMPLLAGFVLLGIQNQQITGSWKQSPYQLYTDEYTPNHRYGFDNVQAAASSEGPDALRAYNAWAKNLTPGVAVENVFNRVMASLQWTLGIVPLLFGLLLSSISLLNCKQRLFVLLLWASLLSLHIAHVPYWYDGIMHWHYVFESAPLLLMIAVSGYYEGWRLLSLRIRRQAAAAWFAALIMSTLCSGWGDAEWAWGPSKVSLAVSEQSFSRVKFAQFQELTNAKTVSKPALILVDERGTDPQLSYVVNPPDLRADVLVCRYTDDEALLKDLKDYFPDREFYIFDPTQMLLKELAQAPSH